MNNMLAFILVDFNIAYRCIRLCVSSLITYLYSIIKIQLLLFVCSVLIY